MNVEFDGFITLKTSRITKDLHNRIYKRDNIFTMTEVGNVYVSGFQQRRLWVVFTILVSNQTFSITYSYKYTFLFTVKMKRVVNVIFNKKTYFVFYNRKMTYTLRTESERCQTESTKIKTYWTINKTSLVSTINDYSFNVNTFKTHFYKY